LKIRSAVQKLQIFLQKLFFGKKSAKNLPKKTIFLPQKIFLVKKLQTLKGLSS
jgi:hypothetical protein